MHLAVQDPLDVVASAGKRVLGLAGVVAHLLLLRLLGICFLGFTWGRDGLNRFNQNK